MYQKTRASALLAVLLTFAMIMTAVPLCDGMNAHAESITASGKIKSNNVILRSYASVESQSVAVLSKGTSVTIQREIFTSKKSKKAKKRWYYVTANGKSGYVRADLVTSISYKSVSGATTDEVNYRKGPATTFKRLGTVDAGTAATILLPANRKGVNDTWYKVKVNGKNAYIFGGYVSPGAKPYESAPAVSVDLTGKSTLAAALLTNPTDGGKERIVYTFSSKNCTKLFSVKGYSGISTPQGLAYSGDKYYVLYGNSAGQRVVTYSSQGRRLAATKFSFSIGHPNGITWNPGTNLCYIFKGHQKKIYTWDPVTNTFGKSKTPNNCSGGSYDAASNMIYGSSKPQMYVYSADGNFILSRSFSRCSRSKYHYAQDCGASSGFLFHGVSGANYKKNNYLDVYRICDAKYLGTIKVKMGEIESVVVDNAGYVELLINQKGKKDYVWKTPLNVNELK